MRAGDPACPAAAAVRVQQHPVGRRESRQIGGGLRPVPGDDDRPDSQHSREHRAPEHRQGDQPDRRRTRVRRPPAAIPAADAPLTARPTAARVPTV